jgi:dynein heavy chain
VIRCDCCDFRYVKPFEARVIKWERILNDLQDIMDNWLGMQGTWLYLEPIFSSEDICKQMPAEAKRFRTVDQTFRGAMSRIETEPSVLKIAQTDGLLDQLIKANALLNEIQKGLNDYLETKRVFFPRFFFLGNDEMLEILSETKDPLRVQPHL